MKSHDVTRFPPILQLVVVGLLGAYVLLSLLARVVPGLRRLWSDRRDAHTFGHFFEYTLAPAVIWAAATAMVVLNWDRRVPLDGGWTRRELTLGPAATLMGLLLVAAAAWAARAGQAADPSAPGAWIPLLMVLLGVGSLAAGTLTLGRTVKSKAAAPSAASGKGGAGTPGAPEPPVGVSLPRRPRVAP